MFVKQEAGRRMRESHYNYVISALPYISESLHVTRLETYTATLLCDREERSADPRVVEVSTPTHQVD